MASGKSIKKIVCSESVCFTFNKSRKNVSFLCSTILRTPFFFFFFNAALLKAEICFNPCLSRFRLLVRIIKQQTRLNQTLFTLSIQTFQMTKKSSRRRRGRVDASLKHIQNIYTKTKQIKIFLINFCRLSKTSDKFSSFPRASCLPAFRLNI